MAARLDARTRVSAHLAVGTARRAVPHIHGESLLPFLVRAKYQGRFGETSLPVDDRPTVGLYILAAPD
jgi:hypothetical protein